MKKYLAFRLMKCIFLFCSFVIAGNEAISQDDLKMKPFMWVPKEVGQNRVARFNTIKLRKISARLHVTQTNSFKLQNLLGMLNYFDERYEDFEYLHVYIAVATGISAPTGFKNKLILIFAPASSESTKSDSGYYILPEYFDISKIERFKISDQQKEDWTKKYIDIMPTDSLDSNDDYNKYPNAEVATNILSDTRHITYCKGDLFQLIYVKNMYSTKHDLSNNLTGYLGAYPASGIEVPDQGYHYKNRTVVLFEMSTNKGGKFYLEQITGFDTLPPAPSECNYPIKKGPHFVDKGQLCPTHCP